LLQQVEEMVKQKKSFNHPLCVLGMATRSASSAGYAEAERASTRRCCQDRAVGAHARSVESDNPGRFPTGTPPYSQGGTVALKPLSGWYDPDLKDEKIFADYRVPRERPNSRSACRDVLVWSPDSSQATTESHRRHQQPVVTIGPRTPPTGFMPGSMRAMATRTFYRRGPARRLERLFGPWVWTVRLLLPPGGAHWKGLYDPRSQPENKGLDLRTGVGQDASSSTQMRNGTGSRAYIPLAATRDRSYPVTDVKVTRTTGKDHLALDNQGRVSGKPTSSDPNVCKWKKWVGPGTTGSTVPGSSAPRIADHR